MDGIKAIHPYSSNMAHESSVAKSIPSAHSTISLYTPQKSISRPISKLTTSSSHGSQPRRESNQEQGISYNIYEMENDVTRWSRDNVDKMMEELLHTKEERRQKEEDNRKEVALLARRIPVDILAREWLNKEHVSLKNRAYLIEKLLPYVVMGVESLLMEAARRNSVRSSVNVNFNPLNYLASYLMRNNPRFSNFSEASPYIRGLRSVSKELELEMFQFADNKLARLKVAAKEKREQRLKEQEEKRQEHIRLMDALQKLYDQFMVVNETKVDVLTVRSAVKSFTDILMKMSKEVRNSMQVLFEFEVTESDIGRKFSRKEFTEYLQIFTDNMNKETFDKFVQHLDRCGRTYRAALEKEDRKQMLSRLFLSCDTEQIGSLDRKRILALFDQFYEKLAPALQKMLRNPHRWPVREVTEIDLDREYEEEEGEGEVFVAPRPTSASYQFALELVNQSINMALEQMHKEGFDEDSGSVDESEDIHVRSEDVEEETKDLFPREAKVDDETTEVEKQIFTSSVQTDQGIELEKKTNEESELQQSSMLVDAHIKTVTTQAEKIQDVVETAATHSHEVKSESKSRSVSFLSEERISRQETGFSVKTLEHETTQASSFSENNVNLSQFIHITENFLGDAPDRRIMEQLVEFIRDGYQETEEERLERVKRAHRQALSSKRKWTISVLYDKWDNDGSGYLEFNEVETLITKYKNGSYGPGITAAKEQLRPKGRKRPRKMDAHLTKQEFETFLYAVVEAMDDYEEFDSFLDFLLQSVERSQAEKMRGIARKKWLGHIVMAGYTCGAVMDPIYRAVFQALFKDAESHGDGKLISAILCLLEANDLHPERGEVLLRNVAATQDCASVVVGRILYPDMANVSFQVVETGNPLHLPRIGPYSSVTFWDPETRTEGKEGALVIIPLKDRMKRVFGTINIDTLNDTRSKTVFLGHEIQFYQGVAKAFSIAFHFVEIQRRTLRVSESALSWICRRSPSVQGIIFYARERDPLPHAPYVLRKMMQINELGDVTFFPNPPKLERRENLFRSYLFNAVDTSESISEEAYGERHLAFPLRAHDGTTTAVIDINIGPLQFIPNTEMKEIQKLLRMLQEAYIQIVKIILGPTAVGEAEDSEPTITLEEVELMFDRIMLQDLKETVSRMDAQAYAELKSYKNPPPVIHKIIQVVLALFYPDKAAENVFQNWEKCKKYVSVDLGRRIVNFDPFNEGQDLPLETLHAQISEIPHDAVDKHGSKPAQNLYAWLFVCISLMQHSRKLKKAQLPEMIPDRPKDDEEEDKESSSQEAEPSDSASPKEIKMDTNDDVTNQDE